MGVAERFYEAFALGDFHTMGLLYAPHARFSDPVFRNLDTAQVRAMWQMLLTRSREFTLSYNIKDSSADRAQVIWIAEYIFTGTGRPVSNRVVTDMRFAANRIVQQQDHFSFWRWSRQALGLQGTLLGWSPLLQSRVRAQAMASLARSMEREQQRSGTPARSDYR
jgi:hypothetical protein